MNECQKPMGGPMKCSFCNKKAIFFRKYEGRHLCENHFAESIERKVKRTIREHKMLEKGKKIAVALSGPSSCTALLLVHSIVKDWPKTKLIAISIDEGVGDYRKESLKAAKKFCKSLKVEHHIFSFKKEFGKTIEQLNSVTNSMDPCLNCGIARRYLLNKKARELGADRLCTGHNLDDEVQGILLNYMKGDLSRASRMEGLLAPSTKIGKRLFVPRIKPLRNIPEEEIALYARIQNRKNPNFPPSPKLKCPFEGGLRIEVKKFLDSMEQKYPGMKLSFLNTFDKIRPHLERQSCDLQACSKCGEPATGKICKTCQLGFSSSQQKPRSKRELTAS